MRSLTHLSVKDGFEVNPDGKRGFRVGIDASIWFYHATYGREGENPELRTLFFRCTRLMTMPFLPLFVFDGPKRPEIKRGKRVSGKNHWVMVGPGYAGDHICFRIRMEDGKCSTVALADTSNMQAPGEAEADLELSISMLFSLTTWIPSTLVREWWFASRWPTRLSFKNTNAKPYLVLVQRSLGTVVIP